MITINVTAEIISVESPYSADFISGARKLGGKWNSDEQEWQFKPRHEQHVRELCLKVYGTDGSDAGDLVVVRAVAGEDNVCSEDHSAAYVGPIEIGRAFGRDSGVRLSENVAVLSGEVFSGGSRKNWMTIVEAESVIEIEDVPRGMAEAAIQSVAGRRDWALVEIVS